MSEAVSAQASLTERYEQVRQRALRDLEQADYHLYRIAMIYSGQLTLEAESRDRHPGQLPEFGAGSFFPGSPPYSA